MQSVAVTISYSFFFLKQNHSLYTTFLAKQVVHKQVKPYDVLHFEISDSPLKQENGWNFSLIGQCMILWFMIGFDTLQ
jgi:hypothetical protein